MHILHICIHTLFSYRYTQQFYKHLDIRTIFPITFRAEAPSMKENMRTLATVMTIMVARP